MPKTIMASQLNQPGVVGFQNMVSFNVVQQKVLAYYDKMKKNKSIFEGDNQFMQFYIDKNSFKRMSKISKKDGFDSFAAFFGLGAGGNPKQITVCFVGVDEDKKILAALKPSENIDNLSPGGSPFTALNISTNVVTGADDDWQPPVVGKTTLTRMDALSIKGNTNIFTLDCDRKDIETFFC